DSDDPKSESMMIEKIKHNSLELNDGLQHQVQVFWSLFVKRIVFSYRNMFLLFAQFILPGCLLLVSILANRNRMNTSVYSPSMAMSLNSFRTVYATSFHDQSARSIE